MGFGSFEALFRLLHTKFSPDERMLTNVDWQITLTAKSSLPKGGHVQLCFAGAFDSRDKIGHVTECPVVSVGYVGTQMRLGRYGLGDAFASS